MAVNMYGKHEAHGRVPHRTAPRASTDFTDPDGWHRAVIASETQATDIKDFYYCGLILAGYSAKRERRSTHGLRAAAFDGPNLNLEGIL